MPESVDSSENTQVDSDKKPSLIRRLESAGRLGASLIAGLYASGFVVVAVHHSQFGIADFSLLKAKVFSAGLIFWLLLAIPALAAARTFALLGLQNPPGGDAWVGFVAKPEQEKQVNLMLGFLFYYVAVFLANSLSFLFESSSEGHHGWWFFSCAVVNAAVLMSMQSRFQRHPKKFCALALLSSLCGAVSVVRDKGYSFFWYTAWLYGAGLGTVFMYHALRDPRLLKSIILPKNWTTG